MRKLFTKIIYLSLMICTSQIVQAQVSGKVFQDFNANGIQTTAAPNPIEPGLQGVIVNANDVNGAFFTATTSVNGAYTITGGTAPYRIEFILPPSYYASNGSVSNTTIQFVNAGTTTANLGVNAPGDYCQSNPDIMIPVYGAGDPELSGSAAQIDALVRFPYTNSGASTPPTVVTDANKLGTVWGNTYQRETKKMVHAAFLKRHCGLESNGLGALFVTDMNTAPGTTLPYINVEDFGINVGSSLIAGRTLPASATTSSTDPLGFTYMAKVGMGSIDFSEDAKTLWIMNMYEKKIVAFQIGNPIKAASAVTVADFKSFAIPDPGCNKGNFRPWAIQYYQGKVYVGVICSGELTGGAQADLFASVYRFDPATETWEATPVITFPLTYNKGDVHTNYPTIDKWETWANTFADLHDAGSAGTPAVTRKMRPQPILSDIQFDKRGFMILGFCDRTGHQTGRNQVGTSPGGALYNGYVGGDILYCKPNATNGFTLESNGQFPGGPVGSGVANAQGPGNGEFFALDNYTNTHLETSQGGLVYNPALDEVMVTQMDPLGIWSGGMVRHNVSDGSNTNAMRYQLYDTNTPNGTFGKANGLGDLELLCDAQPIEIGNRVWIDTNSNGIQDPSETPVDGVVVKLKLNGVAVQTQTTANGGLYYFTNVLPNTAYTIEIENFTTQNGLLGRLLTSTDANTNADDTKDNDATVSGTNAVIAYTTGSAGQNNHTLDFGFRCAPVYFTGANITAGTCNAGIPNADVKLNVSSNGLKSGISSAGSTTYNGPAYSAATSITGGTITYPGLLGTGTSYIVRVFSGSADCFKDTTINVAVTSCTVPCIQILNVTAGPCTVTPLNYTITTVSMVISWPATVTGNIILEAGAGSRTINTSTAVSPLTVTFDQLTDGMVHVIRAFAENDPTCQANSTFTSPASCTGIPGCDNTGGIVTGTAFNDLNNNGLNDSGEGGFANISVKIYNELGAVIGMATTDAMGNYTITGLSENVRFRLEFGNIPSNLEPTLNGFDNTTSVYFSTAPDCIHIGLRDKTSVASSQDIEIGNFVWIDSNGNGAQDPNEDPVQNVAVKLYDRNGILVGTTLTNDSGEYYFNSTNVDSTGATSMTGMSPNTQYYVVFGMGQTTNNLLFDSLSMTPPNTGIGATPDQNDSDGIAIPGSAPGLLASMAGLPYIALVSPSAGESNHTYDLGLCLRPYGGADIINICEPIQNANLPDAAAGQSWTAMSGNPSVALIDAKTGVVTGMTANGTYIFVLAQMVGNCSDTVRIIRAPKPVIADTLSTTCIGFTKNLTTLIPNYNTLVNPIWTLNAPNGTILTTPTNVSPTSSTDYYFVGSNAAGCSDTAKVSLTVLPDPTLTIVSKECTSVTDYKVTFTTDAGAFVTADFGTVVGNEVINISIINDVKITSSLTTGTTTCQIMSTVTPPNCACPMITSPIAVKGSYTICQGSPLATLEVSTDLNTEVDWYNSATGGFLILSNSLTYTPTAAGTYFAEARSTSLAGCHSQRTALTVTINPKPIIPDGTKSVCVGSSFDLTNMIIAYGSLVNPTWTVATVGGTLVSNPTQVTATNSATYILVAENNTGCKDTAQVVVAVNQNPNITLVGSMCSANLQTYSANFLTNGDMTTASIGTVLGTSVSLVPIADAVIVTAKFTATGCVSTSTIPAPNCNCPMVAAPVSLGNMTVCMGQAIPSLSAQVNTDEVIDWYDAATGGTLLLSSSTTFTPTAAGTYYAMARKTASNCSSARTPITLTINPSPSLVGRDTSVCENTTFNLGTLVNNYNQTLNHKWYLSTLASAPIAENTTITSTATYFLMADNSFGCADTTQLTITVLVAPTLTCSKTDATTTGGTDGMASVAVSGGVPAYQYRWSNGNLTSSINGLSAGTYAVTVTDANTCSSVCTSLVAEPASNCNLIDGGLKLIIDQKSTATTADDEYVIFANPTGTGLAATYNVGGDINFSGVAYGTLTEIGRVPYSISSISYVIEDGTDANCSFADATFGLNANTCLLQANISVVCSDAGTPNDPSDDTFSISLNPSGNGIGATYNVTGDITASNIAFGSAQTIASGLLISSGARTISISDATTSNCEILNINVTPPTPCSNGVICTPKCGAVKVTRN